jgi:hypothetical protein
MQRPRKESHLTKILGREDARSPSGRGERSLSTKGKDRGAKPLIGEMRRDLPPEERARQVPRRTARSGPLLATQVEEHAQRLGIGPPELEAANTAVAVVL